MLLFPYISPEQLLSSLGHLVSISYMRVITKQRNRYLLLSVTPLLFLSVKHLLIWIERRWKENKIAGVTDLSVRTTDDLFFLLLSKVPIILNCLYRYGKKWESLSCVHLFVTPRTIQSMEFSRPEYWSGYLFPFPGDLPNPGIEPRNPTLWL